MWTIPNIMVILHKENRVFSTSNYEKTLLSRIFI